MDNLRLDAPCPQPARQPEAIAAGFVGDGDPRNPASRLAGLVLPTPQQGEQRGRVRRQLLQWMTRNARNNASDQPTRLAHLDHRDDGRMLLEGGAASAQIVGLGHERLHRSLSATMVSSPRRRPHTIFNRRTANSIAHRFARLIQQAVLTQPTTYHDISRGTA